MSARILLVRHGRSGHLDRGWVDAEGFRSWCAAYDAAGLAPGEAPPAGLAADAASALVVASPLQRARHTASLLAPGSEIITSDLLRETDIPIPSWRGKRPVMIWLMGSGMGWERGRLQAPESPEAARARAAEAARWLIERAAVRGTVIAVTHGSFRRLLGRAMIEAGWRGEGKRGDGWGGPAWRRYSHWSAWTYHAPETPGAGQVGM